MKTKDSWITQVCFSFMDTLQATTADHKAKWLLSMSQNDQHGLSHARMAWSQVPPRNLSMTGCTESFIHFTEEQTSHIAWG
jgi:hypothetical protein